MATSNEVILGYWGVRGRAGAIRNLLSYLQISFKNKNYHNRNEWFAQDKDALGLEYPSLPYLLDGDNKITDVQAILSYIALRSGRRELIGNNIDRLVEIQTARSATDDLRRQLNKLLYTNGNFEAEKETAFANGAIKERLESLNKKLEGKEWICGALCVADFDLFESIDLINDIEAFKLEKYGNLVNLRKRFLEIPQVKAHRSSPEFMSVWCSPLEEC